jgi:ADP-heptose:LPS heptosyltransferase
MDIRDLKYDCRHFKGHIPCGPNKLRAKMCPSCDEYSPITHQILIIKLGALGDVIRTTPLVVRFRKMYPGCHITWITQSPAVLPKDQVDLILSPDHISVMNALSDHYDIALNLDKEKEACLMLARADADQKFGFTWTDHHIDAATPAAEHKLVTGLFDNVSKANTKNYLEEIFEICHLDFQDEPYLLNINQALASKWEGILRPLAAGKPIVGLNTGCGDRWKTRLWPKEMWVELIQGLQNAGFFPLLQGGAQEHEMNLWYQAQTGAHYAGHFSLEEFFAMTSATDIVVTQVSMMMHIAIGLKKKLVLFNNIFNPHEFYLYNKGVILEPSSGCECYYGNTCKRGESCMKDLSPARVLDAITQMR